MARRRITRSFGAALDEGRLHMAELLTSELVTNALLHSAGSITLRASLGQHALLVEVLEHGERVDTPRAGPELDRFGEDCLRIVESQASRWGADEGTTHVWFELER